MIQIKIELENKIPGTSGPVKKTDYNAKFTGIQDKIPRISGLATNAALTAVENKIPNINSLVKRTDITQKLLNLKRNLQIKIFINILQLQSLILQLLMFLMQDWHE